MEFWLFLNLYAQGLILYTIVIACTFDKRSSLIYSIHCLRTLITTEAGQSEMIYKKKKKMELMQKHFPTWVITELRKRNYCHKTGILTKTKSAICAASACIFNGTNILIKINPGRLARFIFWRLFYCFLVSCTFWEPRAKGGILNILSELEY